MSEIQGQTILITGASQGIGRAVAAGCASAGATVVACGRTVSALESLADEIVGAGGVEPILLPINLEQAGVDDYAEVVQRIEAQCGGLDALILNAAQLGELAPLSHYDGLTWARTFQVNVHSAFLLLQAALPRLMQRERATIVFTLAAEGLQAKANWGAYAVSKYALKGLFDLTVSETAIHQQLKVNAIIPGATNTGMRRAAFPALDPEVFAATEVVAASYLALLCGRTKATHGEIIALESSD